MILANKKGGQTVRQLSEEAQEIIYACRDAIAFSGFNPTPDRWCVCADVIKRLTGGKPSEQAMQELIAAGLLKELPETNMYYVVDLSGNQGEGR